MPQPGDTKQVNGQWGQWNGRGWVPIETPQGQSTLYQTPTTAFVGELGRTAKEAGMGLLRSPKDALMGLLGTPKAALQGVGELVKDPSLLMEIPSALKRLGDTNLADPSIDPREMGSLLGQTILGEAAPALGRGVRTYAPAVGRSVGRGMSKVGRGFEAVGKGAERGATTAGAVAMGTGNIPAGIGMMATPQVLKGVGKLAQKGGGALEQLRDYQAAGPAEIPIPAEVVGNPIPKPSGLGMSYDPHIEGNQRGTMTDAYPGVFDEPLPDFTYEGEANLRPGEYPPGPTVDLPTRGASPQAELASLNALKERMVGPSVPTITNAQLDPRTTAAFDRGRQSFFEDPELQARRRAAIDALKNLDSFKGLR